jgi:uncharacterized protein
VHDYLLVELENLPASGWHHHAAVSASILSDPGQGCVEPLQGLCSDLVWDAELTRKGDCYHLSGNWKTTIQCTCRRCNVRFRQRVEGGNLRDFRVAKKCGGYEDDVLPSPGKVNLLDVLREDVWLSLNPFPLCRLDCKGLCPRCGHNMNKGACTCQQEDPGHPFAALKKLISS